MSRFSAHLRPSGSGAAGDSGDSDRRVFRRKAGSVNETIAEWESGTLTDTEALRTLCSDLGEIESEIATFEAQRKAIRAVVERITTRMGGKASASGYALAMTSGGTRVTWNGKALDSLLAKLAANGYPHIAEELAAARSESPVAASLRITREK